MVWSDVFISKRLSISLLTSMVISPFLNASIFDCRAVRFFVSPLMLAMAFAVAVSLQRIFPGFTQRKPFSFTDFCNHSNFAVRRDRSTRIFW